MKKSFFLIIFISSLCSSVYAKGYIQDGFYKVFVRQEDPCLVMMEYDRNLVRDGIAAEFFETGEIQKIGFYNQGVVQGAWKSFWSNGQLRFSKQYREGILHGAVEYFARDGAPHFKLEYKDGQLHGIGYFYEDGQLVQKTQYDHGQIVAMQSLETD
ncbi:MAG TPA: hypothetical protein VLJ10_01935 [Candidatus Bathyarchaeia archaeon]|nr:hypothetical protein [Candidatus Bathyarchaeia archaeon]